MYECRGKGQDLNERLDDEAIAFAERMAFYVSLNFHYAIYLA